MAAYIFPAALVWGGLAALFWLLGHVPLLVPLLALAYTLWFGAHEALGLPQQVPSLAWQMPSGWINRRSPILQALTWGTMLGPGLVTRNPYAGMWLLPLLLALNTNLLMAILVGLAIGAAHGGARALGVLSNREQMDDDMDYAYLSILGAQLRWLYLDGLLLLLAAYSLSLLGAHL